METARNFRFALRAAGEQHRWRDAERNLEWIDSNRRKVDALSGGKVAYVYMPKRRVMSAKVRTPVVAQLYGAVAVAVNLVASLPRATAALFQGKLNSRVPATILIAVGAFIPGVTSGLNRFGVTWSFFLGEFLGVLLILIGFLVSEEVFRNVRLGVTLWSRRSLESEVG